MREPITRKLIELILRNYFENHEGSTTLARRYRINPTTIQKWLSFRNRAVEIRELVELKGWDILATRKRVQRRAAMLRSLKRTKKPNLRFDESFAYVLGVLCGDGYVSERYVRLGCEDLCFAKAFLKNGERAFGIKASFSGKKGKTGLYQVGFWSTKLATKLRSLYKTRTKNWKIPPEITQGSEGLKRGFLKGFVDSEGYVGLSLTKIGYVTKEGEKRWYLNLQGYVNLSSTNEAGIKQVASLLKDLDIKVHLFPIKRGGEWRICTVKDKSNLRRFKKLINFRTARDRERLRFLIQNIHHSPKRWRWSGTLRYLPKRCMEMIKQERPRGVVFLDRQILPQK